MISEATASLQATLPPSNSSSSSYLVCNKNYTLHCVLADYFTVKYSLIDSEVNTPLIFRHTFNPTRRLKEFDVTTYAQKIYQEPNAGGSSYNSEALSADLISELFCASNLVTEMELQYKYETKKCDYLIQMYGQNVGVSVTRGMKYPEPGMYEREDAERLLEKKLSDLIAARSGLRQIHKFNKSILHIWCETNTIADMLTEVYHGLHSYYKNNIVVVLTVTNCSAQYIFYDHLDLSLYDKFQPPTPVVTENNLETPKDS